MSLSTNPTPVLKVLDPRIDVQKERSYVITKSGNKVSMIPYKSNSTGSSTFSFNVVPPSRNTFIDRKLYIQTTVTIEATANVTAGNSLVDNSIFKATEDAPRSYPLSRALASATATIGNTNVSMQTSDVIDALLRTISIDGLKDYQNGCPTAMDRSQSYNEYTTSSGMNVLGNFTQPILSDGEYARGYFNVTFQKPTPAAAPANGDAYTVKQYATFEVYEPVMLSPFVFSKLNHSSLIGLQNISLVYNFNANSELVWSGTRPLQQPTAGGPAIPVDLMTSVKFCKDTDNTTDAQLWVTYISPSPLMEIPKQVNYNYYEVQRFVTNGFGKKVKGDKHGYQTSNIQLKVIPSLLICGVRRAKSTQKYWHPDAYASISKVSVNFANSVGLLSTNSPFGLYQMSKKNGLTSNITYSQWVGKYDSASTTIVAPATTPSEVSNNPGCTGVGSLLVIRPSEDLGLSDGEASGLMGAFNLQLEMTAECIDPYATAGNEVEMEAFVIVINEGELAIDVAGNGSTNAKVGLISEADVLKAELQNVDYYDVQGVPVGGDFLGGLRNFAKGLHHGAKNVASVVHTAANVLPRVSNGLKSVGLGYGSGLVGSALASKKSLKDRLK